jgi:hypothetical protein
MNVLEIVSSIEKIDEYESENRLSLATSLLESLGIALSIADVSELMHSMKGKKRSETLLNWLIDGHYIIPSTISMKGIEEMLKKCNLVSLIDKYVDILKIYKKSSKGIPRKINVKKNRTEKQQMNLVKTKKVCLNLPKEKRYPTPERKIEEENILEIRSETIDICKIPYEELIVKINEYPKNIQGLEHGNYEKHLKEEEFANIFEMSLISFYKLPKWRQICLKKKYKLF